MSEYTIKLSELRKNASDIEELSGKLTTLYEELNMVRDSIKSIGSYSEYIEIERTLNNREEELILYKDTINKMASTLRDVANRYQKEEQELLGVINHYNDVKNLDDLFAYLLGPHDYGTEKGLFKYGLENIDVDKVKEYLSKYTSNKTIHEGLTIFGELREKIGNTSDIAETVMDIIKPIMDNAQKYGGIQSTEFLINTYDEIRAVLVSKGGMELLTKNPVAEVVMMGLDLCVICATNGETTFSDILEDSIEETARDIWPKMRNDLIDVATGNRTIHVEGRVGY